MSLKFPEAVGSHDDRQPQDQKNHFQTESPY